MTTTSTEEASTDLDFSFLAKAMGWAAAGMASLMTDLGHRCGLFEAAAGAGPLTTAELAERAGCNERYVREWLAAVTAAGIFTYDPGTRTFELPDSIAPFLAGPGPLNMASNAQWLANMAAYVEPMVPFVRNGGGLSYDSYRPKFTALMDELGRRRYDGALLSEYLPAVPGATELLTAGVRVADIGCGTGHTTNLLARAFPESRFVGYDLAADAIEAARQEARDWGLENVTFEVTDILAVPATGAFSLVFAFDCIHDQVDPAGVLAWVERALAPDGTFVMIDSAASSELEDNLTNPFAPMWYGASVLHCLTVSLAHGGAGLGNMWGRQTAIAMLSEAGLGSTSIAEIPSDPFNAVYVARRP
jgi:SAM-dependent methyltransferase